MGCNASTKKRQLSNTYARYWSCKWSLCAQYILHSLCLLITFPCILQLHFPCSQRDQHPTSVLFWITLISGEVTGRIRSTSVAASEVTTHDICHRTPTKEPKFETSNNTIKSAYNEISVRVFQMHFRATLTGYEILVQFCPIVFRTLHISIRTSLLRLLLPLVLPLYAFPFVFLLRQPHLRKYTTRLHRNIM